MVPYYLTGGDRWQDVGYDNVTSLKVSTHYYGVSPRDIFWEIAEVSDWSSRNKLPYVIWKRVLQKIMQARGIQEIVTYVKDMIDTIELYVSLTETICFRIVLSPTALCLRHMCEMVYCFINIVKNWFYETFPFQQRLYSKSLKIISSDYNYFYHILLQNFNICSVLMVYSVY